MSTWAIRDSPGRTAETLRDAAADPGADDQPATPGADSPITPIQLTIKR